MTRGLIASILLVLGMVSCSETIEPVPDKDRIASGVEATVEARQIESSITATLEAMEASAPKTERNEPTPIPNSSPTPDNPTTAPEATAAPTQVEERTPVSLESQEAEREVLVALFNATDGPNWVRNSNWLSDKPLGQWHGLTTNDNGRVIELRLGGNGLTGELPSELRDLRKLVVLHLYANSLVGEIPADLGLLINLTELNMFNNKLTGPIPPELGNLRKLKALNLSLNDLEGKIPPELGNLTELEELRLGVNFLLHGRIPAELGAMTNLEVLYLEGNRLTGRIPPEIGNLTNLVGLFLRENKLTGSIPPELGNLSNLLGIYLESNLLSGEIPSELSQLSKLEDLGIEDNWLSGCVPSALQGQLARVPPLPFCGSGAGPVPTVEPLRTVTATDGSQIGELFAKSNGWRYLGPGCPPGFGDCQPYDGELPSMALSSYYANHTPPHVAPALAIACLVDSPVVYVGTGGPPIGFADEAGILLAIGFPDDDEFHVTDALAVYYADDTDPTGTILIYGPSQSGDIVHWIQEAEQRSEPLTIYAFNAQEDWVYGDFNVSHYASRYEVLPCGS